MKKTWRIGLYVGLAIFGGWTVADAQTQPGVGTGNRSTLSATRDGASAAARRSAGSSYNRVMSTSRRSSAYPAPRGTAAGFGPATSAENDPFRPYSAQARQTAAMISPTRLSEAPPSPPRVEPQARYDYYPGLRGGQQIRRHCTPSRGGVLAGSVGRGR
jgi:hypothetical protein